MKHGEKVAPVMAALTGLATIACCLPMGFAAAAVTASLGMAVAAYQPWFLGVSVLLLIVGGRSATSEAKGVRDALVFISDCLQSFRSHRCARGGISTGDRGAVGRLVAITYEERTTDVRYCGARRSDCGGCRMVPVRAG